MTAETMAVFFGSEAAKMKIVKKMVLNDLHKSLDILLADTADPKSERLLIHAFSNSGMINVDAICNVCKTLTGPDKPMPHTMLVLDSTPGGQFFWKEVGHWSLGVAIGIRGSLPWPQLVTLCLAYLWCTLTIKVPMLFSYRNIAARGRVIMNDPQVFTLSAHRLYLFSEKDPLIDFHDIEQHAAEAAASGYNVHLQKFSDSTHCGHMRMYRQEYWEAVTKAWDASVKKDNR